MVALTVFLAPGLSQSPPSLEANAGKPRFLKLKPLEGKQIDAIGAQAAGPRAVGTHRPIEARSLDRGEWKKLSNGASIWRLGIESPGAAGMRVHFAAFDAGAGRLWIHAQTSRGKPEVAGPYSGKGPHQDGDFWSDIVFSSSIVIEYGPAGSARKVPFRIPEISHLIQMPRPGATADRPFRK
jgi:hypothetical protein